MLQERLIVERTVVVSNGLLFRGFDRFLWDFLHAGGLPRVRPDRPSPRKPDPSGGGVDLAVEIGQGAPQGIGLAPQRP